MGWHLFAACGLLLVVVFHGCSHERPTPGLRSERLVVLMEAPPRTLDPRFTVDAISQKVSRLVFSSLVSVDNPALQARLDVAAQIERLRDDTYRVTLKRGVLFHDGSELTAADVAYTFNSILDRRLGSPYYGFYYNKLKGVSVRSRYEVQFTVQRPYASFVTDLVMGIVPAHVLQQRDGRFARGTYIGSGPYRFVSDDPGRKTVLERFDKHHGAIPHIRYLVFRAVSDENTRILALVAGSADLAINATSPVIADVLRRKGDVKVHNEPSISFTYLLLNLRVPALADVRVRQAIAHGIDREAIIREKLKGMAVLASGMLNAINWAYNGDVAKYAYDPQRARALLEQAGFGGGRLRLVLKTSNSRLRRVVMAHIARNLRRIGIRTELVSLEFSTFIHDVRSGNFEAVLLQLPEPIEPDLYHWWIYSLNVPDLATTDRRTTYGRVDRRFFNPGLLTSDHPDWLRERLVQGLSAFVLSAWGQPPGRDLANRSYYFNPRLDRLLDEGRYCLDRERRRRIYHQVQDILAQDLPVIPLWHEDNVAIMGQDLAGYRILPNAKLATLVDVRRQ